MIAFRSSEEILMKMDSWLPTLRWILFAIIIIELSYLLLFGHNDMFYNIMAVIVITLFVFFILSDTSRLLLESKKLECKTHSCVNYPLKSSKLVLDYINIFVRLLKRK